LPAGVSIRVISSIRRCRDDERAAILDIVNSAAEAYRGVMGIQPVREVDLIRHAYVRAETQRRGVGGALLLHLRGLTARRMLVGTWAAADWAIRFYLRNGFELVAPDRKTELLKTYWTIPDRQIETSVVLANPAFDED